MQQPRRPSPSHGKRRLTVFTALAATGGLRLLSPSPGRAWLPKACTQASRAEAPSTGRDVPPHGMTVARPLGRRGPLAMMGLLVGVSGQARAGAATRTPVVDGKQVVLNNGLAFPTVSFGLQEYPDAEAERLVQMALGVGYRNFFSSVLGGNQAGFARGVAASGVPREKLFICGSVVSQTAKGFDAAYSLTKRGCAENLKAFSAGGIEYLDMIMLDYPGEDCDSIRGQWKAFEEMLKAGKTRSLAVGNFSPEQLDCILSDSSATPPAVNQLGFPVGARDTAILEENRKRGVLVQAWSPLGTLHPSYPYKPSAAVSSACAEIGKARGKSAEQVALRWIVQSGAAFTTQSKVREHFADDLDIFDFQLTDSEMGKLSSLRVRIGA